jgi:HK97 family phage portal protein
VIAAIKRLFGGRAEQRADLFAGYGYGFGYSTGRLGLVNVREMENLSPVVAAIQAIAGTLSTLPAAVYHEDAGGRVLAPEHPVSGLILAPNDHQTWPDFIEFWLSQALLHGNGLAGILFDGAGRPASLVPVPWQCVSVMLLPTGRLAYDVIANTFPWGGIGLPRRFLADEVLHLRDRSDEGYLGRPRMGRAPDAIENALGLQQYSNEMWRSGVSASGVLQHPKTLSEPARKRMVADMDAVRGVGRSRRTLLLEEGLEFKPLSASPEQAEVLESRRFSVEEVCRLFGVPPPILQDYTRNTFSNATTAGQWFAQFSLLPWVKKIEAEFARVLLPDPSFQLELDLSGLLRGDFAQRWAANVSAVQAGILTPNEVRQAEGWNRHVDGDVLRVMPGVIPVPRDQGNQAGEGA